MMKTTYWWKLLAISLFVVIAFSPSAQAQPQPGQGPAPPPPPPQPGQGPPPLPFPPPGPPPGVMGGPEQASLPIEKVSPGVLKIGDITIHKDKQGITFPAMVNMDKGLLEYLIVQARGKTHESLLRTRVEPYHLQIALLLLGFEGTDRPLRFQGDPEKPKGDPIDITISYQDKNEKTLVLKPEEWVAIKGEAGLKDAGRIEWVYTGSLVHNGRFFAQIEGSIAAIYHDPVAIIDNITEGGESDKIWFVKEGKVPPVGTPVEVMIQKKSKQ